MRSRILRAAVVVIVLFSFLVPASAQPLTSVPAVSPSSDSALPPALAQASIGPAAWARITDQVRAQQAPGARAACQGAAAEYAEQKKLLASDGDAGDEEVDVHVPGCPPKPGAIAQAILQLLDGKKPEVAGLVKFG